MELAKPIMDVLLTPRPQIPQDLIQVFKGRAANSVNRMPAGAADSSPSSTTREEWGAA